jgi:uncharacterized protein
VARSASWWFLALGLLGCLNSRAAGPVWVIRGAHDTVYLAGSIHLLRAADAELPAALTRAYADSARLVMEIDLGTLDPHELAGTLLAHGTLPADTSLPAVLGPARYQRVSAAAAALGLPPAALERQTPWMVGLELTELEYARLGFDPEQGVEQQLVRRAHADQRPTAGLEQLSDELAVFEALGPRAQLRFLDLVVDGLADTDADTHAVLDAWRRGDAGRLTALLAHEYREDPALYSALVSDRNRNWLPAIERLLEGNENSLVVVGALHLVGTGGLLELLRKDGHPATQLD